jgi:hypothetical protein
MFFHFEGALKLILLRAMKVFLVLEILSLRARSYNDPALADFRFPYAAMFGGTRMKVDRLAGVKRLHTPPEADRKNS